MRVAVVTGAGSGIGRAVTLALADAGWTMVITGRREAPLREVASLVPSESVVCVPCDVTDERAVDTLFDRAVGAFGRVDLLFNNAGVAAPAVPLDELPVDALRATLDTNVLGSLLCARAAMRVMKAQSPHGGRIINNGSISAYGPRLFSAPYTASKHAITGLTKALIVEGRPHAISCGQIDIGNAVTDMSHSFASGTRQANGDLAPEPRMDVGHAASMVVQMASLPVEANIAFVTIMASAMPLYGRG